MIFDETSPNIKYFQKPIFGKKTLLKNPDGSRTNTSYALTAGLSWMGGLSPLGSEVGKGLDNLIQGKPAPSYLSQQEWYQNNVDASEAKANMIGTVVGGVSDTVRGIVEKVAGSMTGTGAAASVATGVASKSSSLTTPLASPTEPLKLVGQTSPTDPSTTFNQMLKSGKFQALTPDQRIQQEQKVKRQMQYLPEQDPTENGGWRFYSDTAPVFGTVPNFLGNFSKVR